MKRLWLIGTALLLLAAACSDDPGGKSAEPHPRGLVIFGADGMDPVLLRQYMREGKMPNLSALAERGGFAELGTSDPPQSPVAWSNFITGREWDGHGIFDFVHRDAHDLAPYLSTSRVDPPDTVIEIGSMALPLSSAEIELLRGGRAFWQDLEDAHVPATVVKVPANFPPADSHRAESLAGMGTPDLIGTPGTFQLFTSNPELAEKKMSGGEVHRLEIDGHRARSELTGPPDPMSAAGEIMTLPVEIVRDARRDVAVIRIGEHEVLLGLDEWSDWVPVAFEPGLIGGAVQGMVRIFLAEIRPHLRIYVSPINLDPTAPAMPLSAPASYVEELAADVGRFYTQGMPLETKALAAGALSDAELLRQADILWQERMLLLDRELDRYSGGLLFFYISLTDQLSHVFWRSIEPDASPEDAEFAHVIPDIYQKVDAAVGEALERLPEGTDVLVISDHGFGPYDRKVHLNTWLANQGYLQLLPGDQVQPGPLGHVDWANTQAYGLGLNQLFLNLRGREKHGAVDPARREVILRRIERALLSWRDPQTGQQVVTSVNRPEPGDYPERAPDLLVGYNRGYRSSDSSALLEVGAMELEDNDGKWSGDHCIDPRHVPGVILSNRPLAEGRSLIDLAPTIHSYFDVTASSELPGAPVFADRDSD